MESVDWNVNSVTVKWAYALDDINSARTELRKLKVKYEIPHNKSKIPASIISKDTGIRTETIICMHFKVNNFPVPKFLQEKSTRGV